MGALLLAAGAAGQRWALPHAPILIPQPVGGLQGHATDSEIHAREMLRMRESLDQILSFHTGKDMEAVRRDTERDFFMDGERALQYGIVDKILTKHAQEMGSPSPIRGDESG